MTAICSPAPTSMRSRPVITRRGFNHLGNLRGARGRRRIVGTLSLSTRCGRSDQHGGKRNEQGAITTVRWRYIGDIDDSIPQWLAKTGGSELQHEKRNQALDGSADCLRTKTLGKFRVGPISPQQSSASP